MAEQRPLLVAFLAFAVALGALGAAAGSAAVRCTGANDCAYELSLSIFALAPAALIGILVAFLMRMRAEPRWLRTLLFAVGVGVATVPLAGFLLRELWMFPVFAVLVAALIVLALLGEGAAEERSEDVFATAEGLPATALPGGARPATLRPRVGSALALLQQLADLNSEIIRLCEALPRGGARRPH